MIKSLIRLGGYVSLLHYTLVGVILLVVAELLGILEEFVDKRKES